MLEELSKKDKVWRNYAYKLCGNKNDADDLVQDMYLKMYDKEVSFNESYIKCAIRWIHIDNNKTTTMRNREKPVEDLFLKYFATKDKTIHYFEEEQNKKELISLFNRELSKLFFVERYLLLEGLEKSTRELEKKYNIDYQKIWRYQKEAEKKLKSNFLETYNKYQKGIL